MALSLRVELADRTMSRCHLDPYRQFVVFWGLLAMHAVI